MRVSAAGGPEVRSVLCEMVTEAMKMRFVLFSKIEGTLLLTYSELTDHINPPSPSPDRPFGRVAAGG